MKTDLEVVMQDIVTNGLAHQENGNVDSPTGYFSVVEVPAHPAKLAEFMTNLYGATWKRELEWPKPGWHYVHENNYGAVTVEGPEGHPGHYEEWFGRDSADYQDYVGENDE